MTANPIHTAFPNSTAMLPTSPYLTHPLHSTAMAALSHHTMPLEYSPCRCCLTSPHQNRPHLSHSNLCKPPASPERTSPCLIATFPALTAIPHLSRPFHTSSRRCTLPALPFRSLTCRSRPIRSSANLPNQASPNETSPDLDCHTPSFRTK
jgi:hypothetical protein